MPIQAPEKPDQYAPGHNPGDDEWQKQLKWIGSAENKGTSDQSSNPDVTSAETSPDSQWINKTTPLGNISVQRPRKISAEWLKKIGPLIALTGGFAGISLLLATLASPAYLIIHITDLVKSRLSYTDRAMTVQTNKLLRYKFKETKNAFSFADGEKCGIKCKFGSINDTMLRNLKAKGFDVSVTESSFLGTKRYTIDSLTFPLTEGRSYRAVVTDGAEFAEMMKDPAHRSAFNKVFNSRTAYFLNSRFGQIIKTKFGIDKLQKLKSDYADSLKEKYKSAKERVIGSVLESLGITESADRLKSWTDRVKATATYNEIKTRVSSISAKVSGKVNIITTACTAYSTAKTINAVSSLAKATALVKFAQIIALNQGDATTAGHGDIAINDVVGSIYMTKDKDGKTVVDSASYKELAYGDSPGRLNDNQKLYSTMNTSVLSGLTDVIVAAIETSLTAVLGFRLFCIGANSVAAQIATCLAATATTGGGCVIGAILGMLGSVAAGVLISQVIAAIAQWGVPALDEQTSGDSLGSAVFNGSYLLMGGMAAGYGLRAGKQSQFKKFLAKTQYVVDQNKSVAMYEAKSSPFDISNQYSFLGTIVSKLGVAELYNKNNPLNYLGKMLSAIPVSFATLNSSAFAYTTQDADIYAPGKCADVTFNNILVIDGTASCNPPYYMDDTALEADMYDVTDYMINNKFINTDTGEPIILTSSSIGWDGMPYANKTDYQNYLDNCVNREMPLGQTANGIESPYYEWEIGVNCTNPADSNVQKEISYFSAYVALKSANESVDEMP